MIVRIVDLSATLKNGAVNDPPAQRPYIIYSDHEAGRDNMLSFFPGAAAEDLPNGLGWAFEGVMLGSHTGTHLDAPWHYHPTMSGGQRAITIDEVPLEWCYGDGVKLDFSDKGDGYLITAADVEAKLKEIGHELKEGDIVFIQSGADPYCESEEYIVKGCGMGRESTNYLTERGVHIVGTDAWSWDRPLPLVAKEFVQTRDKSIIWEGHFAGIDRGYCHIEKLTNLDKLPATGYKVACFPIKIEGGSAGWVRPVAIFED